MVCGRRVVRRLLPCAVVLVSFVVGITIGNLTAQTRFMESRALQAQWITLERETRTRVAHLQFVIQQQQIQLSSLHQFAPDMSKNKFKTTLSTMRITGYAPLDPKAIKGFDYSGDPAVTASGRRTLPGVTVAASKAIPFGSWIWIDTLGWRRVDDRGGAITHNKLDVCFSTCAEAAEWGVRHRTAIILTPVR